ncbi:MAG: OB-fold nucleic acid binding domain-containing protein, partial [Burkholderiaceae bacterium]
RPVDVLASDWDCTLEETTTGAADVVDGVDYRAQPAVRLGLNSVRGLQEVAGRRVVAACRDAGGSQRPVVRSVETLAIAADLDRHALQLLARAGALQRLAGHRSQAAWEAAGVHRLPGVLAQSPFDETPVDLPAPSEGEETVADYQSLGIPMGRHPLAILRERLARYGVEPAAVLKGYPDGRAARASGLVTHRQRPETAKGVIFVTLEDDTGAVNVIIWPDVLERDRRAVLGATLMTVYGKWQRDVHTGGKVMNLVAGRVVDHSALLGKLKTTSRDFR